MKKAAIILAEGNQQKIYPASVRHKMSAVCEVVAEGTPQDLVRLRDTLKDVEILFSGWGPPRMDEETLDFFPRLKLVLYGAGSLKSMMCDYFWTRDIPVCSAWIANAVPVAEFTFAQIILSLKQVQQLPGLMREAKAKATPPHFENGGAYGTTVSLISLGVIGRKVARLLQNLDVEVLAYDPFCSQEAATELGVKLVSLEEAFSQARVVSLHTPWLKETEGMITGDLLASIPPGGTFINTARGAVVNEAEMIRVLEKRPDLSALLDVTYPEPPVKDSPFYTLPNVFLTPHIAGSIFGECGRMGEYMVDECRRWISGEKLIYQVSKSAFEKMA
ncbi:hydroxyacid dehydrogenase [Kiritimatiellaeota bacterium B1221]|nr:hydroxyacid dehydrogenase [Kiritimatiellaeota bacterium B1221]